MLKVDYFKDHDELVLDLSLGFLFGSTQSTTNVSTNALMYITKDINLRDKLREEMKTVVNPLEAMS